MFNLIMGDYSIAFLSLSIWNNWDTLLTLSGTQGWCLNMYAHSAPLIVVVVVARKIFVTALSQKSPFLLTLALRM